MGRFWSYMRKAVNLPYKALMRKIGIIYNKDKNVSVEQKTDLE